MPEENVEIVRRIYAGWAKGDLMAGAAELDRHVAFVIRPPFPESAAVLGREAVSEYMRTFLKGWRRYSIEANTLRAVGDTVLVDSLQSGEGMTSGVEVQTRFFMLFTFRGTQIIRIESILDEREAFEAAGVSE